MTGKGGSTVAGEPVHNVYSQQVAKFYKHAIKKGLYVISNGSAKV